MLWLWEVSIQVFFFSHFSYFSRFSHFPLFFLFFFLGKSTLMKRLLPMLKEDMKGDEWLCDVVSSPLPGTTVKNVAYKFDEKYILFIF